MHIDDRYEEQLTSVIESLCCPESYTPVFHKSNHQVPMPSIDALSIIVNHLKMILFPGFFGHSDISPNFFARNHLPGPVHFRKYYHPETPPVFFEDL